MTDIRKSGSLKYRLLFLSLAIVLAVWIATAIIAYFDATEEFGEILDAYLAQAGTMMAADVTHDIDKIKTRSFPLLDEHSRRVTFQIWGPGNVLLLHAANAPQQPLTRSEHGFSNATINGSRWRTFSIRDKSGKYLIEVAELSKERDELSHDIAGSFLKPLWISVPLLALLLWMAVTRSLRPLVNLTLEVARRDSNNLSQLHPDRAPREIVPLIDRINILFGRIETSLQKERRFTSDAAHELRTPVAGIKAQAQVARSATNEVERIHALDNVIIGCDHAAHLIDQLLILSRLDILNEKASESCSLRILAAEEMETAAPAALNNKIKLELSMVDDAIVCGNPLLLRLMLRNLIDNAIRHTGPGTTVQIGTTSEQGKIALFVRDNGPGISEAEIERATERFYRSMNTKAPGSGLGLSIVKSIADIHSASLHLSNIEGGGLVVSIEFSKRAG